MTFKYLSEKYKNLTSEEEFVNDYSYKKPQNLKYKGSASFKRPKLFKINKYVENYESYKEGSKKILQEFQNLFIHKFLLNNNKKKNKIKKTSNLLLLRENLKKKFKMNNDKKRNILNKIKEDTYNSVIKIVKSNNKENIHQKIRSRSNARISRMYNSPERSSKNKRKSTFKLSEKNKYLTYQFLKLGNDFISNNDKASKKKPIPLFQEKSRLALLKKLSSTIIQEEINNKINNKQTNEPALIHRARSSYDKRRNINLEENNKLLENKLHHKKQKSNSNNDIYNPRYFEISRKGDNFSEAIIIEKKEYPNTIKQIKKRERRPRSEYLDHLNRPMSSLERYFIKYGAIS